MLLGSYKFMNGIPSWWIVIFINNVSPLVIFILSFSVSGSCLTICDPMNCSMPNCPVLYYLTELAQSHVHCQWCHPTISSFVSSYSPLPQSFPASGAFPVSQSALCNRWPKNWSFSFSINPSNKYPGLISFRVDRLISLLSKRLSRVFSSITVRKHQFFGTQPSLWSNSHIHPWLLEKP